MFLAFGDDDEEAPKSFAASLSQKSYIMIGCEDADEPETDDPIARRLQGDGPTGAKCSFN